MNWNATSTAEIAADLLRATLAASGGARNPQVPISTLRLLRAGGRTQRVARYGLRRFQSDWINRVRQRFGEPAPARERSGVPGARHAGRVRRCSQSSGTDQYIAVAARRRPHPASRSLRSAAISIRVDKSGTPTFWRTGVRTGAFRGSRCAPRWLRPAVLAILRYRSVHCGCCAPAAAPSESLATVCGDFNPIRSIGHVNGLANRRPRRIIQRFPVRATLAASGGARNPQVPISTLRLLRAATISVRVGKPNNPDSSLARQAPTPVAGPCAT